MQKINRKWIAMILVISLLTSFPVYAADADTETPVETEAVRVSEVESLRETNSETYLMSDGTYQCVVYAEDKYYLDSNDTLQRIDNTIVLETASAEASLNAASVARYKNAANAFGVRFSASGVPEISMAKDGGSVTFSPLTAAKGNTLQMNAVATPITVGAVNDCAALGQLTPTGSNTVTYKNAFANTDLVYVLENGALKEYIILRNSNAAGEFSFLFILDGLTLETVDDNAYLTDSDGNAVFALSDLFAIDANGVLTEALSYSFTPVKGDDQIIVTVTLDESYLQAADRTFPVIIDPSITISSVQTADACVCSYYPNTNYKTAYQLRTGKDTDYGIRRSYIKFNIPDSVPKYGITSATLELEKVSGATPSIRAYLITEAWSSSSISWNDQPSYDTTCKSAVGTSSDGSWYVMDVGSIVRHWTNEAYGNNGFLIMDTVESNTSHWTTFYSSDASSPHKPELNISYDASSKAKLVGVDSAGHDHASCLTTIQPMMTRYGVATAEKHTGQFTAAQIMGYLDTDTNAIFVSRSHGGVNFNQQQEQVGTCLGLNDSGALFKSQIMTSSDLSNMTLIAFVACKTGAGGNNAANLPSVAVQQGATVAIGFKENVGCASANNWTIDFFRLLSQGYSVQSACYSLKTNYTGTGLDTYVICGSQYITLYESA